MGIEPTSEAWGALNVYSRRRRQSDEFYRQAFGPIPAQGTRNRFLFVSPLTRQRPESPSLLLTLCPTVWYTLQCGIHRIAGIYSAAPSASRCVGRRGFAPHTRGFAQESREG
jgi:hypothetical protein